MTDDLSARMRGARAEDLMIMARGDGIMPEAVAAARAELIAREIPHDELDALASDLDAREQEDRDAATKRLPGVAWAFYFLLGMSMIGVVGILAMSARGRDQMVKDAIGAIVAGFATIWGLLIAAFVITDLF